MKKKLIIILCLTVLAFGTGYRYIRPQVNTVGLVGHYKLWAGLTSAALVFDYSLNGNDGVVSGSDIEPVYPGFSFNNSDDLINCGNDSSLQFSTTFSVSAWINATSLTNFDSIVTKTDAGFNNGWSVYWNSNVIRFVINAGANIATVAFTETGVWHHVAVTYDGATMRIYLDGVAGTPKSFAGSVTDNTNDVQIGLRAGGSAWDGKIGEVMIFNVDKAAAEIKSIYEITRWRYGV